MANSNNLSVRIYGGFRGVDFRSEEADLNRSPDSVNMWKDYKDTESIRTRPGLEKVWSNPTNRRVNKLYAYKDTVLAHIGYDLYDISTGNFLYSLTGDKSNGFVQNGVFYLIDGNNMYIQYDGHSVSVVDGYIPTTTIGRKAGEASGGVLHEDVNMLTGWRKNTFCGDGAARVFYLDVPNFSANTPGDSTTSWKTPKVWVNGVKLQTGWQAYPNEGKIVITQAPPAPLTPGQDNVVIQFYKEVGSTAYTGEREKITRCTLVQVFDNRVFFSGNPEYPNILWHSSLRDPTYCSDTDKYQDGFDDSPVRGMVAGNNALWVFREPSAENTTVFYHTPTIDDEYGKIYPSSHSSITTGCEGGAVNFNDDIVFFSNRGMEGMSGDITTEQAISHRSSLVDCKMNAEEKYKDMVLAEWEGYLVVFIGNHAYLADSRTAARVENHREYEWFYWELPQEVTCACVKDGVLYVGTSDGIYTFTDMDGAVESHWSTPKDRCNYPSRQKTTNKRGCVAEATGDVSVQVKVEDTGWENIGTYEGVTDYFVSRIKRKKWKDIQLKFTSATRFSLESVTLECFVGGYIKR